MLLFRRQTLSILLLSLCQIDIGGAITADQAAEQIKSLPCKDGMTTDQTLDHSIKSHSQRDIGWRVFQEADYIDVERAVLINKGMELRYRWRVQPDGNISAENNRTLNLCKSE